MKVINSIKLLFFFLPLVIMANFSLVSISHGADMANTLQTEAENVIFQTASGSGDGEEEPEDEDPDC